MDTQTIINALLGILGVFGAFLLNSVWNAINEQRRELAKLQDSLHREYVQSSVFNAHASRVENLLERIYDKLDLKADKT